MGRWELFTAQSILSVQTPAGTHCVLDIEKDMGYFICLFRCWIKFCLHTVKWDTKDTLSLEIETKKAREWGAQKYFYWMTLLECKKPKVLHDDL